MMRRIAHFLLLSLILVTASGTRGHAHPEGGCEGLAQPPAKEWGYWNGGPKVLEVLQELHKRGESLQAQKIRKSKEIFLSDGTRLSGVALYKAALRYFKGWGEAVVRAGFSQEEAGVLTRWSKDKIVEVIQGLARQGLPLNDLAIRQSEEVRKYLQKILGEEKKAPGSSILNRAIHYFGSWPEALRAAGLDPSEHVKHTVFWNREKIAKAISELNSRNIDLSATAMQRDQTSATEIAIFSAIGLYSTGARLYDAAARLFEGWDNALIAANVDPSRVRKRGPQFEWSREKIILAYRELARQEAELSYSNLTNDVNGKVKETLEHLFHASVTGRALLGASGYYFGHWENAVQAAGLKRVLKFYRWTPAEVISVIRNLRDEGIPLSYASLYRHHSQVRGVVMKNMNASVGPASLISAAEKLFGSLENAFRSAGVPVREIVGNRFWSEQEVLKSILSLKQAGLPLQAMRVLHDPTGKVSAHLTFLHRRLVRGASLWSAGVRRFGSWEKALYKAGMMSKVRGRQERMSWSEERVLQAVRFLVEQNINLNFQSVVTDSNGTVSKLLTQWFGQAVTGNSLYQAGISYFGDWNTLLRKIGIDPVKKPWRSERGLRGRPEYSQWESQKDADGQLRHAKYIGRPEKPPLDHLIEQEEESQFRSMLENLNEEELRWVDQLLDLLSKHEIRTLEEMAQKLTESLGQPVTVKEVQLLFKKMATRPV